MQKKYLNIIIIISIVGIFAIFAYDSIKSFTSPKTPISATNDGNVNEISPTITPRPTDNKVICRHSDFPFEVGNKWEYIIKKDNGKPLILITELTEVSTGSATFKNLLDSINLENTKMKCNTSGIYGMHIPINLLMSASIKDLSDGSFLSESWSKVRFLPPSPSQKSWNTILAFDSILSLISNDSSEIVIRHQSDITGQRRNITVSIDESTLPIKLSQIGIKSNKFARYTLESGVGITKLTLFIPGISTKESEITVELKEFKKRSDHL